MSLIASDNLCSYFCLFLLVFADIPTLLPPVVHHLLQIVPSCALHFVYLFLLVCLCDNHIFTYLNFLQYSLLSITTTHYNRPVTYSDIQPFVPPHLTHLCDHFPTALEHPQHHTVIFPPRTSPDIEFCCQSSVLLRSTQNFAPHFSRPYTT